MDCKVIAIVIFPMSIPNDWRGMFGTKIKISDVDFKIISSEIYNKIKLPIYKLSEKSDMIKLRDLIINFF